MNDVKIRNANLNDAEDLERCMHRAYSIYEERMGNQALPPLEIDYANEIENYPTWVAESNGKIVGGLTMFFNDGLATLSNIAVDSDFQGHGLGRSLMTFAENEARNRGFAKLNLATHTLLTENLAIYKHLGWKETNQEDMRIFFEKELF